MTTDYFSNFVEVDHLRSTTSGAVIKHLKAHFARHRIPEVVISDNGPQLSAEEFKPSHLNGIELCILQAARDTRNLTGRLKVQRSK